MAGILGARKKLGWFDDPEQYRTPGIGDDIIRLQRGELLPQSPGGTPPMTGIINAGGQGGAPSFRPQLPDFSQENMRNQLPDSSNQPRPAGGDLSPELAALVGKAPEQSRSFWEGGRKLTLRDGLAGLLAVFGDAASRQNGRGSQFSAVENLSKRRADGLKTYQETLGDYQMRQRIAGLPNMTSRELAAFLADPKAWGSNMARAATSRYDAATLNPGDQRVFGDPQAGGGVYQAPTRGQQYAQSLGFLAGSTEANNAIRDQELGAYGPTAFGQKSTLADAEQERKLAIEAIRQKGRMQVRGAPTYRDQNPPPPRPRAPGRSAPKVPTATDGNGRTVYFRGGRWVDGAGRAVQ